MSQDTGSATDVSDKSPETPPPAGNSDIEISTRRRWPLIAGVLVVVAVLAGVLGWRFLGSDSTSPNETPGATLTVVTAEGNAAEQALVEYIGNEVAPRYGIKVAFKGLADSTTLNRAVSDGACGCWSAPA